MSDNDAAPLPSEQRSSLRIPSRDPVEEEFEDLMRPSTPPPEEEEDELNFVPGGVFGTNSEQLAGTMTTAVGVTSSQVHLVTAADLRGELVKAQCLAECQKLHPYQIEAVEAFIKASPLSREIQLFIQLCVTENKLDAIITAAPAFAVSPALLENIKSYAIAVLLSAKLSAYKGTTPRDHVFAIVLQERAYVPENISRDTHAKKVVHSAIQEELTQARSRIKKAIKASIMETPTESDHIYDLAASVVANTRSSITIPLCARLAFLRKIYVTTNDATYWDKVDSQLTVIRNLAGKEVKKITRAFERILDADCTSYGDRTTYTIATGDTDTWQNNVDTVITDATLCAT